MIFLRFVECNYIHHQLNEPGSNCFISLLVFFYIINCLPSSTFSLSPMKHEGHEILLGSTGYRTCWQLTKIPLNGCQHNRLNFPVPQGYGYGGIWSLSENDVGFLLRWCQIEQKSLQTKELLHINILAGWPKLDEIKPGAFIHVNLKFTHRSSLSWWTLLPFLLSF